MIVQHLTSVDGEIVFDIDPDVAGTTAGATRVSDDVTIDELGVLARAMTYTFAAFELRAAGAMAGIRPRLLDADEETMARYREEIRPLVEADRFVPSDHPGATEHTGRAVAAAAAAWLQGLEGRTVAVEAFGAAGGAVARDVVRRGAKVVAVSTRAGAIADGAGFDVEALFEAHAEHGDAFVTHLGLDLHRPAELHGLAVDVLVAGDRTGVYTADLASDVQAGVVCPAGSAPYTAAGLDVLRRNRVAALPGFVTNGGAVVAEHAPLGLPPNEVLDRVDRLVAERIEAARLSKMDPIRHAATLADTFVATWIPHGHRPDGPALA